MTRLASPVTDHGLSHREHESRQEARLAKGQKRSTREAKKPKADKKPAAATASPFTKEPAKKPAPPRSGS